MNHACRTLLSSSERRKQTVSFALRHARVVTDPQKLAQLKAEAEKRNRVLPVMTYFSNRKD
jgi:hypothetical protein